MERRELDGQPIRTRDVTLRLWVGNWKEIWPPTSGAESGISWWMMLLTYWWSICLNSQGIYHTFLNERTQSSLPLSDTWKHATHCFLCDAYNVPCLPRVQVIPASLNHSPAWQDRQAYSSSACKHSQVTSYILTAEVAGCYIVVSVDSFRM